MSRDGYSKPAFNKEYSSEGRPQRQRIRTQRPTYGSDRPRFTPNREEGGFRPEGFGASLRQDNAERGEYRQTYGQRPRFNAGGYSQRQQGGYRQRYNNEGEGYNQRQQGFRPRQNAEGENAGEQYGNRSRGGYGQQGGYNRGGYVSTHRATTLTQSTAIRSA